MGGTYTTACTKMYTRLLKDFMKKNNCTEVVTVVTVMTSN
jgi:hypothetical protein